MGSCPIGQGVVPAHAPSMRTRTSIAILAALALAAPAAAEAAPKLPKVPSSFKIRTAKFVAHVQGKQVTTWNEPRWKGNFDCQGQRWQEGGGKETVTFKSAKPTRITATKAGPSAVLIKYGSGRPTRRGSGDYIETPGRVSREGRWVNTIDPGWCFNGGPTSSDTGPYDCRTIGKPGLETRLVWRGNRMEVDVLDVDGIFPDATYKNCPIIIAHGVEEAGITKISQRYPVRELFDRSEGLVEVLGRKTFKYEDQFRTGSTRVTWKVRLRRMR